MGISKEGFSVARLAQISVILICFFLTVAVLRAASALFLPIIIAFFLRCIFITVVRFFAGLGVPRALTSLGIVAVLLITSGLLAVQLTVPASEWYNNFPQHARAIKTKLNYWRESVSEVAKSAQEIEEIANLSNNAGTTVKIEKPSIFEAVIFQGGNFLVAGALTVFLLYFFLAHGDLLIRRFGDFILQRFNLDCEVPVLEEIERSILNYLITIATINFFLAIILAIAMYVVNLPNPLLWGVLGGIANFVPFLGILVVTVIVCMVSVVTFPMGWMVVLPPLLFYSISAIEGNLITPALLGRRFTINPAIVFMWLIFCSWLWGVAGAVIAVPLLLYIVLLFEAYKNLECSRELPLKK